LKPPFLFITSDNGPEAAKFGPIMIKKSGYNTDFMTLEKKGILTSLVSRNFASAVHSPLGF